MPSRVRLAPAIVAVSLLVAGAIPVSAAPAAFFQWARSSVAEDGSLVVTFDERGVGGGDIEYSITASATAVYACVNSSGHRARAANKQARSGDVSGAGTFTAKNGRVLGSVSARPISAGDFACPSGQTLVMDSVAYTRIVLIDTTNGTQIEVADVSS